MNNPIRISGLFLFFIIIGLLSAFYLIFADRIMTNAITQIGTEIVGAKVELSDGTIDLDKLSVNLNGLKVTNPNEPMSNIIEARNLTFNLDAEALVWKKTIIDEIIIEDLFLNTKRIQSGAIDGRKLSLKNVDLMNQFTSIESFSKISLPDPKELIDSSNLETIKAIDNLQRYLKLSREELEQQYKALPEKQQLNKYKEQLKKIKDKNSSGDKLIVFLNKGSELKKLNKAINDDLKKIKSFTNQVQKTQTSLSTQLKNIESLPDKDIDYLTKQYDLSGDGVGNIAQQLFGNKIATLVSEGMTWYKRLSPIFDQLSSVRGNEQLSSTDSARNSGRNILFPDQQLLPDDLIKLIKINTGNKATDGIKLSGLIKNITSQPQRWSEPLEIDLIGSADYLEQLNIKAIIDHREAMKFNDEIEISAQNISLKTISDLADNNNFSATAGQLNIISTSQITEKQLAINISLVFSEAAFTLANSSTESKWLENIIRGLAQLNSFKVNVVITGTIDEPKVTISAPDLKSLASKMASQAVEGKMTKFKNQLKVEIANKTTDKLDDLKKQVDSLSSYQEQFDTQEADYQKLINDFL